MDGMIKTAMSNNVIYCDVTINPPLCTIVTSGCGGPRTHEPLFTRFSRYSPDLLVNIACCFLQEVVFSANGIAYNNRLYNNSLYSLYCQVQLNFLIQIDFLFTFTVLFSCSTKKKKVFWECLWPVPLVDQRGIIFLII